MPTEKWTRDEYLNYMNKPAKAGSKFKNVKKVVDKITFSSGHEAKRYGFLKIRIRAKEITGLMLQVKFSLGEESYIADFVYFEIKTRTWIVEDAKGTRTQTYIHKRRLMKKFYNITILET